MKNVDALTREELAEAVRALRDEVDEQAVSLAGAKHTERLIGQLAKLPYPKDTLGRCASCGSNDAMNAPAAHFSSCAWRQANEL